MGNNRAFFKKAQKGDIGLGDIFSDVGKKHSPKETAKVFIAGTDLTTPSEADMLAGWQKPFLFARFFCGALLFLLMCFFLGHFLDHSGGYQIMMVAIPFVMPVTLLLMVWEMNIPRNISLLEVLKIVLIGGVLSLIAAVIGFEFEDSGIDALAGLVEEPAKLLVIFLVLKKKNYKYSINGLLIGVAVGTGFAVMETLYYVLSNYFNGIMNGVIQVLNNQYTGTEAQMDSFLLYSGLDAGLQNAVARALASISGHGIYAGLYGYALVKAKGSKEVQFSHMLNPQFLLYFAASILIHALHNQGLDLGLPMLFDVVPGEYLIIGAIAFIMLLSVLRPAVSQAVNYARRHNDGRVTLAVERGEGAPMAAVPHSGGSFQLQCIAGPSVGQVYRIHNSRPLTIGRASGRNDIALPNCQNVSSSHCRIQISGGIVTVTDLGSTNGTFMDAQRLVPHQPMPLNPGATISLGDTSVSFTVQRI